jgi:ABC-type phosphate transport system substrate-binding protein
MKKFIYAFLLVACASIFVVQAKAQVIVIANSSVKVSEVSKSDLADVFTGASSSLKGSHVVPVLLNESVHHELFLRAYIAKSDGPFRNGWKSLVLSGQAAMPKSLPNDAAVVEYVKNNQGAIGYIDGGTPHDGVNVIAVK